MGAALGTGLTHWTVVPCAAAENQRTCAIPVSRSKRDRRRTLLRNDAANVARTPRPGCAAVVGGSSRSSHLPRGGGCVCPAKNGHLSTSVRLVLLHHIALHERGRGMRTSHIRQRYGYGRPMRHRPGA